MPSPTGASVPRKRSFVVVVVVVVVLIVSFFFLFRKVDIYTNSMFSKEEDVAKLAYLGQVSLFSLLKE